MIISFLIDGIISKYAPYSILSLIYLILIDKNNSKKYYIISFLVGFMFDYFYSVTLFYNSFLFLETAFFIKKLKQLLPQSIINYLIIVGFTVFNYYTTSFIILSIIKYISFDFIRYLYVILNSLELNLILALILYLIKKKQHKIKW